MQVQLGPLPFVAKLDLTVIRGQKLLAQGEAVSRGAHANDNLLVQFGEGLKGASQLRGRDGTALIDQLDMEAFVLLPGVDLQHQ